MYGYMVLPPLRKCFRSEMAGSCGRYHIVGSNFFLKLIWQFLCLIATFILHVIIGIVKFKSIYHLAICFLLVSIELCSFLFLFFIFFWIEYVYDLIFLLCFLIAYTRTIVGLTSFVSHVSFVAWCMKTIYFICFIWFKGLFQVEE